MAIDFPKKKELIKEIRKNHIIFAAIFILAYRIACP